MTTIEVRIAGPNWGVHWFNNWFQVFTLLGRFPMDWHISIRPDKGDVEVQVWQSET